MVSANWQFTRGKKINSCARLYFSARGHDEIYVVLTRANKRSNVEFDAGDMNYQRNVLPYDLKFRKNVVIKNIKYLV